MSYSFEKVYEELCKKHSYEYIDTLNLNSMMIEKKYREDMLNVVGKPRNEEVERKINIKPSFVAYFYEYIRNKKEIPTQKEYITYYWLENERWIFDHLNQEQRKGLYGRLCRFYPSMLRDFHFYHLLRESNEYEKVYYNLKCDLECKADILVKKNGNWYGLQLRTKTRNSDYFYEKKKSRNVKGLNALLVDVPIDLQKAKEIRTRKNSLKLYGINELQYIRNIIENIEEKKEQFV